MINSLRLISFLMVANMVAKNGALLKDHLGPEDLNGKWEENRK